MGKKINTKNKTHRAFHLDKDIYDKFTKLCDKKGFIYTRKVELLMEAWIKEEKGR